MMNPRLKGTPNIRRRIIISLFIAVVIYGIWNARNLILGPRLEILEPINNSTLESNTLFIKGIVKNISYISMNGRQIYIDENGYFNEEVLPEDGYNIVEISARDRFGKEKSEQIRFYKKPAVQEVLPENSSEQDILENVDKSENLPVE